MIRYNLFKELADKCKIVKTGEYQYEQDYETKIWQYWDNGVGKYTTKELFEIFKKE